LDELVNSIFVHPWSEMVLKSSSGGVQEAVGSVATSVATAEGEEAADEGAFNFEEMLMNLNEYKAKADGLEFEERKKFAEDVVRKFWASIGGDDEELNDLNEL
jgi:hypothetical protein